MLILAHYKKSSIMERKTRVSVFESESTAEVQLIKTRLENAGIECFIEDKYLSFTTTPTANTLRVLVSILDEKKAFEVIDSYIKEAR